MNQVAEEQHTQKLAVNRKVAPQIHLYLMLAGLLLLIAWAGLKGVRLFRLSQSLLAKQEAAETLMDGGLTQLDPDEVELLVNGLRSDIVILKREVTPFMPLATRLGWLPKYGPTLAAAPQLLEMADAGTEAAAYAMRGMKPALLVLQDEGRTGSPLPELVRTLDAAEPDLIQSSIAMERVINARNEIEDVDALHWRIRALFDQFDDRLPLALNALKIAPALPAIMGMDGARTYLIIAQNQDELRPTGGYISGVGILTVENGEIAELEFIDANLIGNWRNKPFGFPPQPLYELMGLELFLFRDSNFWPDFPTSAEQSMELASYSLDLPPLDGVISMDQQFVAGLVAVTGPVDIAELDIRVTRSNVIDQLRAAWQIGDGEEWSEWINNRKDFLGPFAAALRSRLETDLGSIDMLYLTDTLMESLAEKELQIYMRDPEASAAFDELGWDGRLENPPEQDFLMVVDSNVGYNKVNPLIESAIAYDVTLTDSGEAVAELTLRYIHGGEDNEAACAQGRDEVYAGGSYEELISGCYWNYLRIYAPAGSELLDASRHVAPRAAFYNDSGWSRPAETIPEHPAFATFANFFLLPEGQELTTRFRYQLPLVSSDAEDASIYQLRVARQAGALVKPLVVTITLPEGSDLVSASPEPLSVVGQEVIFDVELDRDIVFSLTYR